MSDTEPQFVHPNRGTCSHFVAFDLDEDSAVHNVQFQGGCNGNLQGIGKLTEGMPASWVIERCQGVRCGMKPTSCPDQLADALTQALAERQA